MSKDIVSRLKNWPELDGDEFVPILTRSVKHMLKHEDSVKALKLCYEDGPLWVLLRPSIDALVMYCENYMASRNKKNTNNDA